MNKILSERFINDGIASLKMNELQKETRAELLHKLCSGIYVKEAVPCLCGFNDFQLLAEKDRYGIPLNTVICTTCGLVMSNPRMTQESCNDFYNHEYRKLYVGAERADENFFAMQYAHGLKILTFTQPYLKDKPNKILEIGCGAGGILKAFQEQGHQCLGIDLGFEYVTFGAKKGLKLLSMSSQSLLEQTETRYDLIILSHVFEHFLDIEQELKIIKALLSDDGVVYIEVPGLKNLHHSYDCDFLLYLQNAHMYHFSLQSLQNVMSGAGFHLKSGDEFVRSIFCKSSDQTFPSDTINLYSETLAYLQDLEVNRQSYKALLQAKKHEERQKFIKLLDEKLASYPEQSIAIYGTGAHTAMLLEQLRHTNKIVGLLDHDKSKNGKIYFNFKVLDSEIISSQIKAVVISSDTFQDIIYQRLAPLQKQGITLLRIYD